MMPRDSKLMEVRCLPASDRFGAIYAERIGMSNDDVLADEFEAWRDVWPTAHRKQ